MQQTSNPLENLKDIYLPDDTVSSWPLAYGWWLLLAIVVIAVIIVLGVYKYKQRQQRRMDKTILDFRTSIYQLAKTHPEEQLLAISIYLKKVAMQKFAKDNPKTLYGQEWLEFLDSKLDEKLFTQAEGSLLAKSYGNVVLNNQQLESILAISEKWLRKVL